MLHQRIPVPGRAAAVLDIYVQQNDSELEMVRWKKRPAILILPGGGYNMVADREGEPYALRYMGIGFQAFVLTYTVKADFAAFRKLLHRPSDDTPKICLKA